jgi:hypothetical protein
MIQAMHNRLSYLSLFTSLGTLVCCALPSLLILLGLGTTVASFLSAAPWLVTLSRHKELVFAISAVLIATNFVYVYKIAPRLRSRDQPCAVEGDGACEDVSRLSRAVLWVSAGLYLVGFFTAYILGPLLIRFSS